MVELYTGKIARFDPENGCGFILPDDGTPMVFVHCDDLGGQRDLNIGTPVRFSSVPGSRGPRAYNVSILVPPSGLGQSLPCRESHYWLGEDQYEHRYPDHSDMASTCILSSYDYREEVISVLVSEAPEITAAEIFQICKKLSEHAARHGWLERSF